ncbi:MAG: MBL fold metallo-hydrolase [bacterium]
MKIKKFIFNPIQVNTYVLYDETRECIIIDPGCSNNAECEALKEFIASNSLKPKLAINTHGHFDHILGNTFVKNEYQVPIILHELDLDYVKNAVEIGVSFGMQIDSPPLPDQYVNENDFIEFGNSSFKVLHCPGHSPGGIALYSKEHLVLISGDVLFSSSIGRTDLPGGDYSTIIRSIKEKLLVLDNNTVVYPGHGNETSIGAEKKMNPFLA